jgi:23S rRNA (cytosine1962-C5)-methyltransferase
MLDNQVILPFIADGEDKSSPLKNRIRKNYRHLRKWAKRSNTNCFRIYDREIPDYPLAIDFYDGRFCVHYFPRSRDGEEPSSDLEVLTTEALNSLFQATPDAIYWRTRTKHKPTRQYEKVGESQEFFTVIEYGVKFRVNLVDYLDTGLFLDHRETRQIMASLAQGKRVLNLFAYTCAFSLQAAAAGAIYTKNVDLSNTYCAWGRENFLLNHFSAKQHEIIRADCMKFLSEEERSGTKYDLIVIDPPTISRSKKMTDLFNVQVDYIFLISKAVKLLNKEGVIFFSTNSRKFVFDASHFPSCQSKEISHQTLSIDFHDPKIHRCWKISLT